MKPLRIGIVAAEASGDQLASHLMRALKKIEPAIIFEGIGGQKMQAQDFNSWYPIEKLSVMGLVEVLKHLPELLSIRKQLVARWKVKPPALFIGVDAPDFNLGLECQLKRLGIPTVHYVCPSIWAWREGRVKTLKKGVDLILSIFPFEVPLLAGYDLNSYYAGHPLAQKMDQLPDQVSSRKKYGIEMDRFVLGVLPGSRLSEVTQLTDDFLKTAQLLSEEIPDLLVMSPMATTAIKDFFQEKTLSYPNLSVQMIDGHSADVMAISDMVLTASGTATLEIMLHKKPMVVAYKVHWLTYFMTFSLGFVKTRYIAMPNILAGECLVPEFFQKKCRPEQLVSALLDLHNDENKKQSLKIKFQKIIDEIVLGDIQQAAKAVLKLVKK